MQTRRTILAIAAALLLIGAGCGGTKKPPAPQPAVNQPAKPSSPGLPRQTEQQFDEDDHLDDALKDLDTVK
ncbi:MAG TPA: hypothetical protein VL426_01715 [Candidatus Binatia bacterium]|nr:hypothetical protein [Candidatus Binatia bacterium]